MRTFKVIRIDAITGQAVIVAGQLTEVRSWNKAHKLERVEARKPFRTAWYAATNAAEWREMAASFFQYRKAENRSN